MDPQAEIDPNAAPGIPGAGALGGIGGLKLNPIIFKEPKGMIRVIQVVFAILAFASTSSFDTKSVVQVACPAPNSTKEAVYLKISYPIEYPFKFESTAIFEKYNCSNNIPMIQQKFPMDFSSSAQFFVATGVLSLLYSGAAVVFYATKGQQYATNPLLPVIDLAFTGLLALFWIAGSSAWTLGVSDLKHYTNPRYLKNYIYICKDERSDCSPLELGNYAPLNISLLCGFTNAFVWCMCCWFVFKETQFHQKSTMAQPVSGYPPGFEQMPGSMVPPGNQTQFPAHIQQQPFPAPQQGFTAQY